MDKTGKYPDREGSPTETKQEYLVAIRECVHKKSIRVANILKQTTTERETLKPRPLSANPRRSIRRTHRADARMVVRDL
jgi:hypothetical protein